MSDLTPIPAEQRRAYCDALLAGRAEAERLGYGLMDDRVFAAFHRALYGPMLAAARADERAKVAEEIAKAIETDAEGYIGDEFLTGMDFAAAIARGHAKPAQIDAAGRKGAGTTETTKDDPEGAQTLSDGSGE